MALFSTPAAGGAKPAAGGAKAAGGKAGAAGGAKKKGADGKGSSGPSVVKLVPSNVGDKVPIGIFKEGAGDPVIKKDEAYPSWLWTIANTPTFEELEAEVVPLEELAFASEKPGEVLRKIDMDSMRRLSQLRKKRKIVATNQSAGKI